MAHQPDEQERLSGVMRDTLTLLVKNSSLPFERRLVVRGILALSVDGRPEFNVHFNERIDLSEGSAGRGGGPLQNSSTDRALQLSPRSVPLQLSPRGGPLQLSPRIGPLHLPPRCGPPQHSPRGAQTRFVRSRSPMGQPRFPGPLGPLVTRIPVYLGQSAQRSPRPTQQVPQQKQVRFSSPARVQGKRPLIGNPVARGAKEASEASQPLMDTIPTKVRKLSSKLSLNSPLHQPPVNQSSAKSSGQVMGRSPGSKKNVTPKTRLGTTTMDRKTERILSPGSAHNILPPLTLHDPQSSRTIQQNIPDQTGEPSTEETERWDIEDSSSEGKGDGFDNGGCGVAGVKRQLDYKHRMPDNPVSLLQEALNVSCDTAPTNAASTSNSNGGENLVSGAAEGNPGAAEDAASMELQGGVSVGISEDIKGSQYREMDVKELKGDRNGGEDPEMPQILMTRGGGSVDLETRGEGGEDFERGTLGMGAAENEGGEGKSAWDESVFELRGLPKGIDAFDKEMEELDGGAGMGEGTGWGQWKRERFGGDRMKVKKCDDLILESDQMSASKFQAVNSTTDDEQTQKSHASSSAVESPLAKRFKKESHPSASKNSSASSKKSTRVKQSHPLKQSPTPLKQLSIIVAKVSPQKQNSSSRKSSLSTHNTPSKQATPAASPGSTKGAASSAGKGLTATVGGAKGVAGGAKGTASAAGGKSPHSGSFYACPDCGKVMTHPRSLSTHQIRFHGRMKVLRGSGREGGARRASLDVEESDVEEEEEED